MALSTDARRPPLVSPAPLGAILLDASSLSPELPGKEFVEALAKSLFRPRSLLMPRGEGVSTSVNDMALDTVEIRAPGSLCYVT